MMQYLKLGSLTRIKTGKLDANAASDNGKYPFFTCSKEPLAIDTYSYDCECVLVAGNGDLNVKYYSGRFDAYQRTYIIESLDKEKLMVKYLYYFLDLYVETLRQQAIGGVIKYIKLGNLTEALIPVPTLEKQQEIVDAFEECCDILERRRQQLELLDQLVKSQFIELFGTISETKYPVKRLADFAHIKHGFAFKGDFFTEADNGILLVTPGNFSIGGGFQYKKCKFFTGEYADDYVLHTGDLIVTMTDLSKESNTLGNAAIVPDDGYVYLHNQRIGLFDQLDEGIDKTYLEFYMRTDEYRKHILSGAAGSTVKHTSPTKILEAEFILPPLEKQKEFSIIKQQTDKSKMAIQQSLEKLETLKKALMQKYFG